MTRKKIIFSALLAVLLAVALMSFIKREAIIARLFEPTVSITPEKNVDENGVDEFAVGLETPWSIAFLPEGDMIISEREGRLKRLGKDSEIYEVVDVKETSEGGLLGIALHPDFAANSQMYLYYTTEQSGRLTNQIDIAELKGDQLSGQRTILADIPAASNHNGGAIAFGPDNKLYVTTGDAAMENLAQDKGSLAGKILRLNDDGTTPSDNPFGNLTWSYGHRNPQGIAWDNQGRLWSVEHGPSGTETGRDELNLIERGANYGWPVIRGDEARDGMKSPLIHSGVSETWAPGALTFAEGKLYFTGLRGQSLYEVDTSGEQPTLSRYLTSKYGRLRAITTRDQTLYISTSNRDGRGEPKQGDDKILAVPLSLLGKV